MSKKAEEPEPVAVVGLAGAAMIGLLVLCGLLWWQGAKSAYRWAYGEDHLWWCHYDDPHAPLPEVGVDGVRPHYVNGVQDQGSYEWGNSCCYRLADPADRTSYRHMIAVGALFARVGVVIWYGITLWLACCGGVLASRLLAPADPPPAPTPDSEPEPDYSKHEPGQYL